MGNGRWDPTDWSTHTAKVSNLSQTQIFTQRSGHDDLNPLNIKVRESVDSDANPLSTPIILAVDETGSMGHLSTEIIKNGLGVIMKEIYDRKPVTDPHILAAAVGDSKCDSSPLQVTQFEASIVLADQVKNFFIEGNGGGNGGESYPIVWYFAANKTLCDAQVKRNKKGYIFTIGDEPPHMTLTREEIKRVFGDDVEADVQAKDLYDLVSQNWEVFHLIVNPGNYNKARWSELLGERAIDVTDHNKLAEVIVSTIQVIEGDSIDSVVKSWSGDTSLVVANAVKGLTTKNNTVDDGVVAL